MKKQRFSKLQKWILKRLADGGFIGTKEVIQSNFSSRTPAAEVSVSRSIWLLIDKGFIQGLSPMKLENVAMLYGMHGKSLEEFNNNYGQVLKEPKRYQTVAMPSVKGISKVKLIESTPEGRLKAQELLNVK